MALGIIAFLDPGRGQHDAVFGGLQLEPVAVAIFLRQLLHHGPQGLLLLRDLGVGPGVVVPESLLEVLQLHGVLVSFTLQGLDFQVQIDVRELRQRLPLRNQLPALPVHWSTDPVAGLDLDLFELTGHGHVDGLGVEDLDFQGGHDVVGQGPIEEGQHQQPQPDQGSVHTRFFHFVPPPGHVEELAQLVDRLEKQPVDRHGGDPLAEHLQSVGLEHLVEEHQDRGQDEPAIGDRRHGVQGEETLVPFGEEGVVGRLEPQEPVSQLAG